MFRSFALALATFVLIACAAVRAGDAKRWWSHVVFVADDRLEGRNTGSEGYRQAAAYVAGEFERAGLKPAGTPGQGRTYFQPVEFRTQHLIEDQSSLALLRDGTTESLKLGEDAILSTRGSASDVQAGLVFVGYGLVIPELKYDDLAGLDLRGKIAVYFSGSPSSVSGPLRAHYQSAGERWRFLKKAGAIGTAAIPNPKTADIPWSRMSANRLQTSMRLADPAFDDQQGLQVSLTINPAFVPKLLETSGHSLDEIQRLADEGKPLPRSPLNGELKAVVRTERGTATAPNVAGILPGSDPKLRNEYVVLSAHLDHLGIGGAINGDRVYNGAMDNASGVATLIEVAQSLKEQNKRFKRSLLFVAVAGEEKGLLGSRYFAAHPTVTASRIVADLNVDMFLPLFSMHSLMVLGVDESDVGDMARSVAAGMGVQVQADPEPQRNRFIRSDQYSFIRRGVPALAFKIGYEKNSPEAEVARTWTRERYHAPSDDAKQPVALDAADAFNRYLLTLAGAVADRPARPQWKQDSFFRRFAAGQTHARRRSPARVPGNL